MKHTITLYEPVQAHKVLLIILWPAIKAWLICNGSRLVVTVKLETRRVEQNNRFHWIISHVSRQIGGDLADEDDAKRILISAFKIDTRNDPALAEEWRKFGDFRVGRGLRGETVLMGNQSRDFTVKLAAAFCMWLEAFCVETNVVLPAPKGMEPT